MKNRNKLTQLILLGLLVISCTQLTAGVVNEDTIMINLGNNKRIIIQVAGKEDLKTLKNYDINKILEDLSNSVDTAQSNEYVKMEDLSGQKYLNSPQAGDAVFMTEKFNRVTISGAFEVDIREGDDYQVNTSNASAIESFKIVDDHLIIKAYNSDDNNDKITINAPDLGKVSASNGTRIYMMGFSQPNMVIELDESALLIGNINIRQLNVRMDNSSKARLEGFGDLLNASLDHKTLLDASEYSVEDAEVHADNGSIAKVNVIGNLDYDLEGSSIVRNRIGNESQEDEINHSKSPSIDNEILNKARIKVSNYELSIKVDDWEQLEEDFENFDKRKLVKSDSIQSHTDATTHSINVEIGMNNYLQNGQFPDNQPYAVKPWGSWFFGINSTHRFWLSGPLFLQWGKSLSWYNFKLLDNDVRFEKTDEQLIFPEDTRDIDPIKSKLTASYLSMNLIPMFDFSRGRKQIKSISYEHVQLRKYKKRNFRIGIGPYIGYRIGSHSKFVYKDGGNREKEKDRDSFYLNTWRYGLRLHTGYKGFDFFFDYDLNPLFSTKGPDLNAISFGLIL